MTTTTAPADQISSIDGRPAPSPGDRPPYPKTERQAEFMALADRLAAVAAENAPAHDRENTFAHDTFGALRESGYLALTVPEEYGGRGATPLETMLAQERLARGDGSVALASTMHLVVIGGLADSRAWPEPLFERVCREVVAEGALVNGVASEPDLGSPSRGGQYATLAVPAEGGWRVNGRKTWTTLSPE
ncbi:MAG: acyl-CoA/acyl-ACP dehydrogenase, partial [Actinomycetota bacterium]|nr:acyl-CoA/acyl-ACP dehydrogenase [Actinomycetota bacterium]